MQKVANPKDGFSAPMTREQSLAKANATRLENLSRAADERDCIAGGVCPDQGKRPSSTMKIGNSPLRAIRAQCLDCVCGSYKEVELCPATECPLYRFRFGQMPETAARNRAAKAAKEGE